MVQKHLSHGDYAKRLVNAYDLQKEVETAYYRGVEQLEALFKHYIASGYGSDILNGCFILHRLCQKNHERLNVLVKQHIATPNNNNPGLLDPFFPDTEGNTAIHCCTRGCNVTLLVHFYSLYGSPKLNSLLNYQQFDLMLIACAEVYEPKPYKILQLLSLLYINGVSLESNDHEGRTPIFWAVIRNNFPVLQWLLVRGAFVGHRDHSGRTVIRLISNEMELERVMYMCRVGAFNLQQKPPTTWMKPNRRFGQWLYLSALMMAMKVHYSLFRVPTWLRNHYAANYLILMLVNVAVFTFTAASLDNYPVRAVLVWWTAWMLTMSAWMKAYWTNPGFVVNANPPWQQWCCSRNVRNDYELLKASAQQNSKHVPLHPQLAALFVHKVYPAAYKNISKGLKLESTLRQLSLSLVAMNFKFKNTATRSSREKSNLKDMLDREFDMVIAQIRQVRSSLANLSHLVASERSVLMSNSVASMIASANDPHKLCYTCFALKPPRSHHCSECGHCVRKFDHHCVWIDNCVGGGNLRSFVTFLLAISSSLILSVVLTVLAVQVRLKHFTESPPHRLSFLVEIIGLAEVANFSSTAANIVSVFASPVVGFSLLLSVTNILWLFFCTYLFFRTFRAIARNVTYYEESRHQSHARAVELIESESSHAALFWTRSLRIMKFCCGLAPPITRYSQTVLDAPAYSNQKSISPTPMEIKTQATGMGISDLLRNLVKSDNSNHYCVVNEVGNSPLENIINERT